jgi:hypothetical protein
MRARRSRVDQSQFYTPRFLRRTVPCHSGDLGTEEASAAHALVAGKPDPRAVTSLTWQALFREMAPRLSVFRETLENIHEMTVCHTFKTAAGL